MHFAPLVFEEVHQVGGLGARERVVGQLGAVCAVQAVAAGMIAGEGVGGVTMAFVSLAAPNGILKIMYNWA